ncbi:MAG TPA: LacI family DNA-binding transcriptional regulator [Egibacteraceae bacterium]|nr:LacI family DNA-binding transcriptional regulator [Egibacteraceae bacterium]
MTRPTLEDVARRAGVSRSLVSLVMRGASNVSEQRRTAVLAAAKDLGYRPNANARNLAQKRTRTLGVVLNDLHNPFFADIADGAAAAAAEHGYHMLLGAASRSVDAERDALHTFMDLRAEGVVLVGTTLPSAEIADAARSVAIAVASRQVRQPDVDTVISDERLGARLAVEHLVGLGHRKIAHIDGGDGAGASTRRGAYSAAMKAFGLESETKVVPGEFTDLAGARAVEQMLADGELPTAIFAANDLVAAGALGSLEDAGLAIPADVSLVGYDNTALAAMHHLSLTSVHQPRLEMGRLAVESLIERLEEGRARPVRHVLTPRLVVRESSAAPPAGARRNSLSVSRAAPIGRA